MSKILLIVFYSFPVLSYTPLQQKSYPELSYLLNGGFDTVQLQNYFHHKGFTANYKKVFDVVTEPFNTISNYGTSDFFKDEFLSVRVLPNLLLHSIGGGLDYNYFSHRFKKKGYRYPKMYAFMLTYLTISNRQAISLHYLEQLFRKLRTGRVVKSVRGPGGGYVLSRSMDEITMKDVLECVGENINPAKDIIGLPSSGVEVPTTQPTDGSAPVKATVDTREFRLTKTYFENLGVIMNEYLTTTTLGDLMRQSQIQNTNNTSTFAAANQSATSDAPSEFASAIRSSIGEINQ